MTHEERLANINSADAIIVREWEPKIKWMRHSDYLYLRKGSKWVVEHITRACRGWGNGNDDFLIYDRKQTPRFLSDDNARRQARPVDVTMDDTAEFRVRERYDLYGRIAILFANPLRECICCGLWSAGERYRVNIPSGVEVSSEELAHLAEDVDRKVNLCHACKITPRISPGAPDQLRAINYGYKRSLWDDIHDGRGKFRLREIFKAVAADKGNDNYIRNIYPGIWPEKPTPAERQKAGERAVRRMVREKKWATVSAGTKRFFKMLLGASRLAGITQK